MNDLITEAEEKLLDLVADLARSRADHVEAKAEHARKPSSFNKERQIELGHQTQALHNEVMALVGVITNPKED